MRANAGSSSGHPPAPSSTTGSARPVLSPWVTTVVAVSALAATALVLVLLLLRIGFSPSNPPRAHR